MRYLLNALLALFLATQLTLPALADKGGIANGNASGHDKSENSSGNNGNNGNGNGNNGNGSANGQAGLPASPGAIVAVPDDQQVVENAVRANAALSLEAITAVVAADTQGRILDVQLVTFKGIYLYDVTVLERDGMLHKLYYNARSGARVRTE